MTHYDTLGVPTSADQAAIKKAFRSKAKTAHPDKGGSDEAMTNLNQAYAVLSDPARKEHYDATGEDPSAPHEEEAQSLIAQLFNQALDTGAKDPLEFATAAIASFMSQAEVQRSTMGSRLERLKSRRGDLDVTTGSNLFHDLIDRQIAAGEASIRSLDTQKSVFQIATRDLTRYKSNVPLRRSQRTARIAPSSSHLPGQHISTPVSNPAPS